VTRIAAALLACALAACAAAPPPVDLSGTWPARAGDYHDVTKEWTRRTVLRGHFQQTLELIATFRSPPWRAAAAAREASARGATDGTVESLARAAAEGDYEISLVVTTYDRAENDLDRGARSSWKLALVDEQGTETPPIEVVRDRRPPDVIRAEVPEFGDFATAYVARFPRSAAALGPDAKRIKLRMWSSRGAVQLVWNAR